ncbi:MAG: hypothetical protein BGN99_13150 [Alphaproteobacteria bacterium 65-37]|jgi:hypothetical protein|uniref:hypothetical protein n=1 Tax=uncultured Reyranella sp. TaxID=735512 RepID=UPI000969F1A0|nr:hypothetical protein [uncultured Reyranella sp.]OJU45063.1 MAG: hypothetical protein BGN99_13150 [Alphaproteobacteria bacterium 65-37]
MADDTEHPVSFVPANGNQGRDETDRQTRQQMDRAILTIARLIGRRIAREQFAALSAPNDNEPQVVQGDGAGKE